jgi:VanZ family protein
MVPLRHRRVWFILSALLIVAVILGSLLPGPAVDLPENFDKVEHWLSYFLLALWFTGLYPPSSYWKVAACLLGLGVAMEILQGVMALGRVPDALDMTANTLGIAVGIGLGLAATGGWARRIESWLNSD